MFLNFYSLVKNYLSINKKKLYTYFFFFLFSFFFWFLTMMSRNHEVNLSVAVQYINYPLDLVVKDAPKQKLLVRVSSPGFQILFHHIFNFKKLTLDFSTANIKVYENSKEMFWLLNSKRKKILEILGSSMQIINIEPERLSVNFYDKNKKKVPIYLQEDINLEYGFWYQKPIEIIPDSIYIYGIRHKLDSINMVYTENIIIDNLNKSKIIDVSLLEIEEVKKKEDKVRVKISVESYVEENIEKEIIVRNLEDNYKIKVFPSKVFVKLKISKKHYHLFSEDDFTIELNAEKMKSDVDLIYVEVNNLPSFIEIDRIYPEKVEYLLIKN